MQGCAWKTDEDAITKADDIAARLCAIDLQSIGGRCSRRCGAAVGGWREGFEESGESGGHAAQRRLNSRGSTRTTGRRNAVTSGQTQGSPRPIAADRPTPTRRETRARAEGRRVFGRPLRCLSWPSAQRVSQSGPRPTEPETVACASTTRSARAMRPLPGETSTSLRSTSRAPAGSAASRSAWQGASWSVTRRVGSMPFFTAHVAVMSNRVSAAEPAEPAH